MDEKKIQNVIQSYFDELGNGLFKESFDWGSPLKGTSTSPDKQSAFTLEDLKKAIAAIPPKTALQKTIDELWCGDVDYFIEKTGAVQSDAIGVDWLIGFPVIVRSHIPKNIVLGIRHRKSFLLEDGYLPGLPEIVFVMDLDK